MMATWLITCLLAADPSPAALTPLPDAQQGPSRPAANGALTAMAAEGETADGVVVVSPPQWREVLRPWIAHRQRQGYRVHLLAPSATSDPLRTRIRDLAARHRVGHIVLVGDAEPETALEAGVAASGVPTHHVRAKVNVHWGSEPEIATDNPYADLDGDGVPELAIGRLPVDSREELERFVGRILRYETAAAAGNWQRQVNFVAGVGGFGPLTDGVLEMATKKFLTDGIPPAYSISMTYGSWRSPFCPDPRRFRQATLDRLNEGCLFWVYIGHGQRRYLDRIQVPGGAFPIFDTEDAGRLRAAEGAPIAVLLACYTGAFDEPRECLAEEMLRADKGPVAVLCGSRVTMPYAMAVMGNALMDEYFRQRRATLGEVLLHTKRRLVKQVRGDLRDAQPDSVAANRLLLDALARTISPAAELLDEERLEHVALFNLLGDPLLQLPHPHLVPLEAAEEVRAGEKLELTGTSPLAGPAVVELVCRRDHLRVRTANRSRFEPTHEALAEYDEVYRQANDPRWIALPLEVPNGRFRVQLPVPAEARGPCVVRITLRGERRLALGATPVYVRRHAVTDVGD